MFNIVVLGLVAVGIVSVGLLGTATATQNSTWRSFDNMLGTDDFKAFSQTYKSEFMDCGNVWKVHSATVCTQSMITHYQNQVIIDELKRLNNE